jgi:glycosyltransferase involved in cell wall biosynthesis
MIDKKISGWSNPVFSIVIPSYNEEGFIEQCLSSLKRQTFKQPFEVIVVDNNSSDQTSKIAKKTGARVILETEKGVCAARQAGLNVAKAPIIISTDADTTFSPDWLKRIDECFKDNPEAVAIGGEPQFVDSPLWGRVMVLLITSFVKLYLKIFKTTCYISAANIAFKKSAFPGYNTKLTQGGDELFLLKKLKQKGKVIMRFDNPVYTSSRRLYRGFLYNLFVTEIAYYLIDYNIARFTGKSLLGSYPAFRDKADSLLKRRNFQIIALALIIGVIFILWMNASNRVEYLEKKSHQLESIISNLKRRK